MIHPEDLRTPSRPHKFGPLISIGLPAFNCEKTLEIAICSILHQAFDNWELLVMEDGSSDRTLEVARSFSDPRICVFTDQAHKGLAPRLNQAVALSCGKYFARMDADDVAYPERLERQVKYLEKHPEIDLLGCEMLVFKGNGIAQGYRCAPVTHEEICRRPSDGFRIGHPTWMGRTPWFRAHPYDESAIRAEDQVLLLRSYSNSRFACLPEILCGYREDKLALLKILRSRYGFTTAAFEECIERKEYCSAIEVLLRQCGKAILDTMAIVTGLKYVVLPHRVRSLNMACLERWAEVWSQLHNGSNSGLPGNVLVDS
jgi:glycosyltransferase involved in cell wall biosynthesis